MTLARTGFKRPALQRPARSPATPAVRRGVYAVSGAVAQQVPKSEKAKPGKGAQTVAEAKWIAAILDRGCIACSVQYGCGINTPAEVHHILRGGRRLGHLFTIPLCPTHHRDGPTARHPYRKRFEREYGAELELLAMLKRELGVFDQASYR